VGVFVPPQEVEAALAAGADMAGNDDLIAHVEVRMCLVCELKISWHFLSILGRGRGKEGV
jgi:ribosomal protein L1